MTIELKIVDAFTKEPFKGNPAAVCVLQQFLPDSLMQQIALEMNLSETAFVVQRADGDFDLRWFTPAREVDLCGHATLATVYALGRTARFHTRSGILQGVLGDSGQITLDFPSDPPEVAQIPDGIDAAIGAPVGWFGVGRSKALAVLDSAGDVREVTPDFEWINTQSFTGLCICAPSDVEDLHFVSRYFNPKLGITEDPVTGSAHCMLGAWWAKQLGVNKLRGYQASTRGGYVEVEIRDDRALLTGDAVTVGSTTLFI